MSRDGWATSVNVVLSDVFRGVATSDPRLDVLNGILAKHGLRLSALNAQQEQRDLLDSITTDLPEAQRAIIREAVEHSRTAPVTYRIEKADDPRGPGLPDREKDALMADLKAYAGTDEGAQVVRTFEFFGTNLAALQQWRRHRAP